MNTKLILVVISLIAIFFLIRRNMSTFGADNSKVIETNSQNYNLMGKINESDVKPDTVLIFIASWCEFCKDAMGKFKDAVAQGNGKIIIVDGDKNPDLVKKYNVNGYPTIIKGNKTKYEGLRQTVDIVNFSKS